MIARNGKSFNSKVTSNFFIIFYQPQKLFHLHFRRKNLAKYDRKNTKEMISAKIISLLFDVCVWINVCVCVVIKIPFQWFWHNVFQFHFLIGRIILFGCISAASVSARYWQRSHIVATLHINGGYFWIRSTHVFLSLSQNRFFPDVHSLAFLLVFVSSRFDCIYSIRFNQSKIAHCCNFLFFFVRYEPALFRS